MENEANTEMIKAVTSLIFWPLLFSVVLLLIYWFREPIKNFLMRLINLSFRHGNSELKLNAAAPDIEKKSPLENVIEPPSISSEEEKISKEDSNSSNSLFEMIKAFREERINDAKALFKEFSKIEEDFLTLQTVEGLFLYYLFIYGKENDAIHKLKNLANASTNEDSKYIILSRLSECLRKSNQRTAEIVLWQSNSSEFKNSDLILECKLNWALALDNNKQSEDARKLLVETLRVVKSDKEKSKIYDTLGVIENTLGNKKFSVYCKDKSLEYNPLDRENLFSTAFQAAQEGIRGLAVSNYNCLLQIDINNSDAANNLGVCAENIKLKTKAIEKYKASAEHGNTLAMANHGFLLLGAGFLDEAEGIAKKAASMESVHENVYTLLTQISEARKNEEKKWEEYIESCLAFQRKIRKYMESYYKPAGVFNGRWQRENGDLINVETENGVLSVSWDENTKYAIGSGGKRKVELKGKIEGNSCFVSYISQLIEKHYSWSDSGEIKYSCLGYLSDDMQQLHIFAEEPQENFSLTLLKK